MPKKEEKTENQNNSKNFLNSLLQGYKDDHFNFIETEKYNISTGSLLLDSLIKVKSGSFIRLAGKGAELGKTSESLLLASDYMKVVPKSKTLFVMAEGRLSEEMQKRAGLKFTTKAEEWDYGTIFILKCNVFETVASIVEHTLKQMFGQGEHLCVIIDSLDGLILKKDLQEKGIEDGQKMAGVPLLTKLLFKRLSLSIGAYNALLIITSQYTSPIKIDPYSSEPPKQVDASGGYAIGHQSEYTLYYLPRYNKDLILENPNEQPDIHKNKIIGVIANIELKKSATDVTGTKVKIPIKKGRIGNAIWIEKEVVDFMLGWDMIKKKGAWFTFSDDLIKSAIEDKIIGTNEGFQFQGINNLYDFFEKNEKMRNWCVNKVKNIISINS